MNAPCHLVPLAVATKERDGRISARPAAGGWLYLRCSACSLRVWIPPNGNGVAPGAVGPPMRMINWQPVGEARQCVELLCKAPPAPAVS